jgi:integrase/recombinase XerD
VIRLTDECMSGPLAPCAPVGPVEVLIDAYKAYLLKERGVSISTVRNYVHVARLFLSHREETAGALDLQSLTPGAVSEFVLAECRRSSVGSAKCMATRLRCLLAFLHVAGHTEVALRWAVPSVASWRLASLPKAIKAADVALLLASCDRCSATGQRDFAVLTVLHRLGLRAGEVAALALSDIDWLHGEMVVTGKANRAERLPLPADVGESVVAWLKDGRPAGCSCPCVFTSVRPPLGRLGAGAITGIVKRACLRAGLPVMGAHRLRHTAATQMLQAGASLGEVGQVLRHRSMNTTAIYAKVDRRALVALVRPWPGGAA